MNKNKTIRQVTDNQLCFGCGACHTVCTRKAITMKSSSIGRILPEIEADLCNECGLCHSVCPGIDEAASLMKKGIDPFVGAIRSIYTGNSTNEVIFRNAQSGGLTTETLSFLFDSSLIDATLVVRPDTDDCLKATAVVVTNKADLIASQKSIYTPIDLLRFLPMLASFKSVAVVGIPCHLQGIVKLKQTFPKKYDNVSYLLGLICDRTLSQGVADLIVDSAHIDSADCASICYRSKAFYNYKSANIVISKRDKSTYVISPAIRHRAKPYFTPPRCKICYDKMNTQADLVFGDPWGVDSIDEQNGESLVVVRSDRGESLIEEMMRQGRVLLRGCDIEMALKGQGIAKRRETVANGVREYKKRGFLLPLDYIDFLGEVQVDFRSVSTEISRYLSYETMSRKEIIADIKGKIKRENKWSELKSVWGVIRNICRKIKK